MNSRSHRLPLLLLAVALAATGGTTAEEPDPDPTIRVYETATVRARPLSHATASVSVLEREEIEAIGVPTVAELIRFIPGLDVTPTGPRGGRATAQIRGGDPNFTLVMIDGVPLNDITDQEGGAVDLTSISTGAVERIEVVRGPVSSFYGSRGLAGAINIITRKGAAYPGFSFGVAGGNDSVLLGRASFGQGDESRNYFVTAWSEQEEGRIAEDEFEQVGFQGNARLTVGGAELQLTGRLTSWEKEDYPEASGGPIYGTGETRRSDNDELSFGVDWLVGRTDRRQKIYATAYRHKLDRDSPMIPPGPSGFIPASSEQSEFTSWRLGWAVPRLEAGRAQIGFGVEAEYEDGESDSTLALPPPFSDGSFSLDRTIGGAFVEVLAERGPLLFELGARVDVPEGFDTELSPRAGIRYRLPNDATRLRASLGRAFKLPSFFALANPIVGNPDLAPEVVIGADVAVDHVFSEQRVDTSLTLFSNRYEDLVEFDFGTLQNVNDTIESRGVEATVGWDPTEDLDVAANVTWQELDRDGSSEPVRQRPEWYGGLRFTWRPIERARWEVDGQWVAERNDEQIPTGPGTVGGYQLYGTAFSYTVGGEWELRARIDNLADKDYEPFIGFPGAGRSFLVGLRRVRSP